MPVSGSHALKLPAPGKALAKQLSQSEWSVPGGQLLALVKTLERESSLKVLDLVWGMENTLQALWDVLRRQEEAFTLKELITTCQQEGALH
ncbi:hypothetical protein HaLaN_16356 [Haematococcus lacustris]|uniref:Uncharacterized protein n=1 Tax=Haematococcus lacustris TaxID=44745 RepID=A0A699ZTU5_HAELA|nr:hypothetical protein HaLaN_16356 [Haematococcus lacustris]